MSNEHALQLERERPNLQGWIAFCARLLNIEKPIKLTIERSSPLGMAAVRKLKDGLEVNDKSEDYNEIELFLYENEELRAKFSDYHGFVITLGNIVHELVHIKHSDWDEDSVQDEDARITGCILDYLERVAKTKKKE